MASASPETHRTVQSGIDIDAVPSRPFTSKTLLGLLKSDNATTDKVAEIIREDPALCARLLKIASSAALAGEVSSISDAVMRIGLRGVKEAAIFLSMERNTAFLKGHINWTVFWFQSLLHARLASSIASQFQEETEELYLAGLIHNIGKVLLIKKFGADYQKMLHLRELQDDLASAEIQALGISHSDVLCSIGEKWSLSKNIIECFRTHHQLDEQQLSRELLPAASLLVAEHVAASCFSDHEGRVLPLESIRNSVHWKFISSFCSRGQLVVRLDQEMASADRMVRILDH